MDGTTFVLLSGTLTVGVPLVLAVRELLDLRRRDDSGYDGDGPPPFPPPPPPPTNGHKPLPECLIPRISPAPARHRDMDPVRMRELERV